MTFIQLFELKNKLYEDFEIQFSKMKFNSEEEKNNFYYGFLEGIETFSFHTMISILDEEHSSKDKAA